MSRTRRTQGSVRRDRVTLLAQAVTLGAGGYPVPRSTSYQTNQKEATTMDIEATKNIFGSLNQPRAKGRGSHAVTLESGKQFKFIYFTYDDISPSYRIDELEDKLAELTHEESEELSTRFTEFVTRYVAISCKPEVTYVTLISDDGLSHESVGSDGSVIKMDISGLLYKGKYPITNLNTFNSADYDNLEEDN